jgi:DNA-binding MarR family transcriptional regulator
MTCGHEMAMGLRAAYWAMHRQTNACFARRRVTADQFVLLVLLAQQDGITQQELVHRASSDRNTVRAMLVLMEKRRLIARERHPSDGRANRVTLTRKGRQVYEQLRAESEPLRERLLSPFSPDEAERAVEFLARIYEAMIQVDSLGGPQSTASAPGRPQEQNDC